jgi:hypothetical protein
MNPDDDAIIADQARILALLDWAHEHDVSYHVLIAAAGLMLDLLASKRAS